jgi:tetratricopeptide (TPR) repeat protein
MNLSAARNRHGHAQAVLLVALALSILVLFIVATVVVNAYGRLEARLGSEWYDRGVADLSVGNAEKAVTDLRTALSYSREVSYRLELARALVAAGHTREAREYLLSLWERQPGSAELNLELARVAALSQAIPAAVGYYEAAIYGAWDTSPELNRRNTRLELARLLIAHNDKRRAVAVIAALASDLPSDPGLHTQVGTLFLQAGDPASARLQFEAALHERRDYAPAMKGAGAAAFAISDFSSADRYLGNYLRENAKDESARTMLAVARTALQIDPLHAHLTAAERRARVLHLFQDAQQRADQCTTQLGSPLRAPDLQAAVTKLTSQSSTASDRVLRRDPDLIEDLFATSADVLIIASKWCQPRHPIDDAVAAVAELHKVRP